MKEIAENAAAAAHCALHLDCFKTFPHHDIPPGSHCTLCYSHQPPTHLCPAAEVRETPLSPFFDPFQKEGKSYSRAKDIFLHWCHAHFVFSINESWYKEDIKPNMDSLHLVLISRFMLCLVSTAIPLYSARCSSGIMGKDKFGLDQTWGENDSMLQYKVYYIAFTCI